MTESASTPQSQVVEAWREDRYGVVLLLITAIGLLTPITEVRSATLLGALAMSAVVVRVARKSDPPPLVRNALIAAAGFVAVAALLGSWFDSSRGRAWVMVAVGLILSSAPILILRDIVTRRVVTAQSIIGAICVYVLFGLVFAFWYAAIDSFPGTSVFAEGEVDPGSHLYFSFVTLTTLGYGDLTPVGYLPRTLTVFEALIGQIFLVTLVARLVTMLGYERSS
jgi:hypothetical protein